MNDTNDSPFGLDWDSFDDNYPTELSTSMHGPSFGHLNRDEALAIILSEINQLRSPSAYNNYSIRWFEYEGGKRGEAVVLIYSAKVAEESDIYGEANVAAKCCIGTDVDAWKQIYQALEKKVQEFKDKMTETNI